MSDGKPQEKSEDQEPSMEEILTSIRKIIASDEEEEEAKPPETAKAKADATPAPSEPDEESEDVLELTEVVEEEGGGQSRPEPESAAEGLEELEARARRELEETSRKVEMTEEAPPAAARESSGPMASGGESLVSEAAASAATAAFARLTRTVSRGDNAPVVPDSGKSVELFVAELLRPMLKEWLDANLPTIVERVVEQEVRKLAKRAELL